jgi:hypothetical protein
MRQSAALRFGGSGERTIARTTSPRLKGILRLHPGPSIGTTRLNSVRPEPPTIPYSALAAATSECLLPGLDEPNVFKPPPRPAAASLLPSLFLDCLHPKVQGQGLPVRIAKDRLQLVFVTTLEEPEVHRHCSGKVFHIISVAL